MTLTEWGLSGAVLQMFSHGIIAGLLFAVVGRMVYDRTHDRDLDHLEGMGLGRALPFAALTFVVGGAASMGLPGFSGFVAELQVLIGAWKAFPALAILSGFGIVIGAAYTLRAMQKSFFGDYVTQPPDPAHPWPPITLPERLGAILLMAATLVIGLFPTLLLDWIVESLNSPLMKGIWEGRP
jgi:NADH-quinone oxidoreductase subunit M